MAERASIHQSIQIGVETTPGTVAPATRRMAGVQIDVNPRTEVQQFKAGGSKAVTTTAKGKEWSEGSLSGVPTYNEMAYLLAANYGNAETTDLGNGATEWQFRTNTFGGDDTVRLTVEQGSDVRAHRASGVAVTDLTLAFNRPAGTQELTGSLFGKAIEDGVLLSADAEALELMPITAEQVTLYLDATQAALGTTALNRAFSVEVAQTGRFSPVWALKASEASYVADVEGEPEMSIAVVLEANAQGMALLQQLRANATRWLRIEAVGPQLGATNYRFRLDAPCRVTEVTDFSDEDGVYAIGFTLTPIHVEDFGGSHVITLTNDLPAL